MPTIENLREQEELFNGVWGLKISIDDIERRSKVTEYLKNLSTSGPRKTYLRTLDTVLSIYFETHSTIGEEKMYNGMRSFSSSVFVEDFEKLMNMKFEVDNSINAERKAYEGFDKKKLVQAVSEIAARYNKTLTDVWADNVINGMTSIGEMKAITNNGYNALMSDGADPQNMGLAATSALKNIVAAQAAITTVREQRSAAWHWVPWHWPQAIREVMYLSKLDAQKTALEGRGYDTASVSASIRENLISDFVIAESSEDVKEEIFDMSHQMKNIIENDGEKKEVTKLDNVVANVNPYLNSDRDKEKFISKLVSELPKKANGSPVNENAKDQVTLFLSMAKMFLTNYNSDYDVAQLNGDSGDKEMIIATGMVFTQATDLAGQLGYESPGEILAAAQFITDKVMGEYSAAKLNPEMAKYAKGYVLNNAKNGSVMTGGATEEELQEALQVYNEFEPNGKDVENNVVNNERNMNNIILEEDENPDLNNNDREQFLNELEKSVALSDGSDSEKSLFIDEKELSNPLIEK